MLYELTDDLTIDNLSITCGRKHSCERHDRGRNVLYPRIMAQHDSRGMRGSTQIGHALPTAVRF